MGLELTQRELIDCQIYLSSRPLLLLLPVLILTSAPYLGVEAWKVDAAFQVGFNGRL